MIDWIKGLFGIQKDSTEAKAGILSPQMSDEAIRSTLLGKRWREVGYQRFESEDEQDYIVRHDIPAIGKYGNSVTVYEINTESGYGAVKQDILDVVFNDVRERPDNLPGRGNSPQGGPQGKE